MWIVWMLLCLFSAVAPSAFVISPSDQVNVSTVVNGTSAVVDATNQVLNYVKKLV